MATPGLRHQRDTSEANGEASAGEASDDNSEFSTSEYVRDFHASLKKVLEGQEFDMAISASARCVSDIIVSKCQYLFHLNKPGKQPPSTSDGGEGQASEDIRLPLAKIVPLVATAAEEVADECNSIVEVRVSQLPEVVRACADAFSVHSTVL